MTRASQLWARWCAFWFRPTDARPVALVRIALGLVLIASHLILFREIDFVFGADGPVDPTTALRSGATRFSYYDGAITHDTLWMTHALGLIPLVLFTIGFRTRLMTALALTVQVAIHHRNPWIQHGGDRVLRLTTLYLLLCDSGAVWSVDAWLARRRGAPVSPLVPAISLRLIQLQTAFVYLASGIEKAQGGMWWNGTALYYALSDNAFQRAPLWIDPILANRVGQALCAVGTWVTLFWELSFAVLIWSPKTRPAVLLVGVAIHVGIFATMMVGTFSPAMLVCYLAWLRPGLKRWWQADAAGEIG